ncbi:MAG: leucine-rich repeat domain-containing protein [Bacteroidaceae bacterium]|nr:leucine-rich repeat domain-containing protein [Bacteroidaceae bacterium]
MKEKMFVLAVCILGMWSSAWGEELDLSTVITVPGTVTYTVENDATYPWSVADGALTNTITKGSVTSWCTIRINAPHAIRIGWSKNGEAYIYDKLHVRFDGTIISSYNGNSETGTGAYFLPAGEHTMQIGFQRYGSGYSPYKVSVSNIVVTDLAEAAIEINLSAAGTLGTEALSRVSTLPEMRYMKLTGPMNSDDWNSIKNMTGLYYLDMEGTSVTEIPASAFTNTPIRVIKFPAGLKTIGEKAFYQRSLVGSLSFPETLESIGNQAFYNTTIMSLTIPDAVTSIGTYAFYDCNNLRDVTYSTGMTTVPSYCFYECDSLRTVSGLDNVASVNQYAFHNCRRLTNVDSFHGTTIGNYAFYYCGNLGAIDLSNVKTIDSYGLIYCSSLTSVDLGNVTSLGSGAFQNCTGLTSITLNDKITTIPNYCFADCSNLEEVHLGASVRSLGQYCFYPYSSGSSGNKITKVYVKSPTPPTVSTSPFYGRSSMSLYVPEYAMVSYKLDDYWSQFGAVEVNPEQATDIVLYGNLELTSNARIPDTPNVTLNFASTQAAGSHFTVNGDNAQALGHFRQYVTNYRYSTSYDPCSPTFISRCANMTAASSEVRYYCSQSGTYWYYICMPFDVKRADITLGSSTAAVAVRYYDSATRAANGAGSSWVEVPDDGTLEAGKGYIFCVSEATYIYLPATEETHNQIFRSGAVETILEEYASETSSNAGWNLVGNPYSSFYDIYHMDYTAPLTVWNTSNKTFTAYSVADDELALYPLQAFFVQKPGGVDKVTFQPTGRQHTLTIEHDAAARAMKAQATTKRKVYNLTLTNGETEDRTRIVVNALASDGYEAETDASKMLSMETTAQIYSLRDGVHYAINEGAQEEGEVQLGVWFPMEGAYTIASKENVELYDNGELVALPYTFEASEGTDETRFLVKVKDIETGIESASKVLGAQEDAMYDLSGRKTLKQRKGVYVTGNRKVVVSE